MNSLRVLVTNDDGIDAPGLAALARCALDLGYEPVVAAPSVDASGTSASLMAAEDFRRVRVERRRLPGLPGVEAYGVSAHPAFIVLAACRGTFGDQPDLVLSGINRGANVGRSILHSGTVGAALTATVHGIPAMALSLDVTFDPDEPAHWDSVAPAIKQLLPELDPDAVLNVNVPNLPVDQVGPLRTATLASFGRVQSRIARTRDDLIEVTIVVVTDELEAGTDAALLAEGYATVTKVQSVSAVERPPATPPR